MIDKVSDNMANKTNHKYKKLVCDNSINCVHCSCIEREEWCQEWIKTHDHKTKIKIPDKDGNITNQTIDQVIIKRGTLDDVIGVEFITK